MITYFQGCSTGFYGLKIKYAINNFQGCSGTNGLQHRRPLRQGHDDLH